MLRKRFLDLNYPIFGVIIDVFSTCGPHITSRVAQVLTRLSCAVQQLEVVRCLPAAASAAAAPPLDKQVAAAALLSSALFIEYSKLSSLRTYVHIHHQESNVNSYNDNHFDVYI